MVGGCQGGRYTLLHKPRRIKYIILCHKKSMNRLFGCKNRQFALNEDATLLQQSGYFPTPSPLLRSNGTAQLRLFHCSYAEYLQNLGSVGPRVLAAPGFWRPLGSGDPSVLAPPGFWRPLCSVRPWVLCAPGFWRPLSSGAPWVLGTPGFWGPLSSGAPWVLATPQFWWPLCWPLWASVPSLVSTRSSS